MIYKKINFTQNNKNAKKLQIRSFLFEVVKKKLGLILKIACFGKVRLNHGPL
jgi:hypothetical protein